MNDNNNNPIESILDKIDSKSNNDSNSGFNFKKRMYIWIAVFALANFLFILLFDKTFSINDPQQFMYIMDMSAIRGIQMFFGLLWFLVLIMSIRKKSFSYKWHLLSLAVVILATQVTWHFFGPLLNK